MHRTRGRLLAVLAFAAALAAGYASVRAALNTPASSGVKAAQATLASREQSFGPARVAVRIRPNKSVCYTITEPYGSAQACRLQLRPWQIGYAITPRGIGGVAGTGVRAVIVKLTRRGTRWATLDHGIFFADIPLAYRVRAVVKVLRDGTRERFDVTPNL